MLAHDGKNPCPEIVQWLDGKDTRTRSFSLFDVTTQGVTSPYVIDSGAIPTSKRNSRNGKSSVPQRICCRWGN